MSQKIYHKSSNIEDKIFYTKFIEITRNIFKSVIVDGYTINKTKDKNIFTCQTNRFGNYNGQEEKLNEFIEALSNYLFKDTPFLMTGDISWVNKKEWILRLADLNPNQEQIIKVYEGLFRTISLEDFTLSLPFDRSDLLLAIMQAKMIPEYEGEAIGYFGLHTLEHSVTNIKRNWSSIPRSDLEPALKSLLISYRPLLEADSGETSEKIIGVFRELVSDPVEFLPYFPKLPQKCSVGEDLFSERDNGIAQFKVWHNSLFVKFSSILTQSEASNTINHAIQYINGVQPGNIEKITKIAMGADFSTLMVESKTEELPDTAMVKKLLSGIFNLYVEDNFEHRFDSEFWEKAVHSIYLDIQLPTKKASFGRNKI